MAETSSGAPPLRYQAFVPPQSRGLPPLVVVHGNGRAASEQFRAFLPYAMHCDIPLIAPSFSRERFAGYQRLGGAAGPLAAFSAFEATLDDARQALGLGTDLVTLVGFSGGAQFVHRYAMRAPARVIRLVVASAGWYTYLAPDRPFPHGCAASDHSGGVPLDADAFLRLPVQVLVGECDVERDEDLRTSAWLDHGQGLHRLSRALRWVEHLKGEAQLRGLTPQVSFDLLPGTGHSFAEAVRVGRLVERALDFYHCSQYATYDRAVSPTESLIT
jgi:pimeloyl-ACP methyl ester carboxylesterase